MGAKIRSMLTITIAGAAAFFGGRFFAPAVENKPDETSPRSDSKIPFSTAPGPKFYESAIAEFSSTQFTEEWARLSEIPEPQRDLAWPVQCCALWERWATADLKAALAALPPSPSLVNKREQARREGSSEEFPELREDFSAKPEPLSAAPQWVSDLPRHVVFATWALANPDEALKAATNASPGDRVAALRGVMETLSQKDPGRFLREAAILGAVYSEFDRERAFVSLATTDPLLALQFADRVTEGQQAGWNPRREGPITPSLVIVETWAKLEPQAAASYVDSVPGDSLQITFRHLVLKELSKKHPAAAARFLASELWGNTRTDDRLNCSLQTFGQMLPHLPMNEMRIPLISKMVERACAVSKPEQFPEVQQLYDLLPVRAQSEVRKDYFRLWERFDPAGAVRAMESLTSRPDRVKLLSQFVQSGNARRTDLAGFSERLKFVPVELADEVRAEVLGHLSTEDSSMEFRRNLVEEIQPGPIRDKAACNFYLRWTASGTELPTVAQALAAEPNGNALGPAYEEVARMWAAQESLAASVWVRALPPGSARDAAITGLAKELASVEPAAAATWLAEINDPESRKTSISSVSGSLSEDGREAFAQQLRSTILNPEPSFSSK